MQSSALMSVFRANDIIFGALMSEQLVVRNVECDRVIVC